MNGCCGIGAPRENNIATPLTLQASIARLIGEVSLVFPFPVAPKSRTLKTADLNSGSGKLGGMQGSFASPPNASEASAQTRDGAIVFIAIE
jgi:hypothetical protein